MSDKVFIGKVEQKETSFGTLTTISLNKTDIEKLTNNLSEKGWVNLNLKNSQKGGQYLEVNTWKPKPKTEDLPF